MVYVVGLITGVLNGLFSSGGGQILLLYLVYIKKDQSKEIRGTILVVMILLSIATIITYYIKGNSLNFDFTLLSLVFFALIGGYIGQKLMKKIEPFYLNLLTGIMLCILSVKQLFFT